MSTNWRLANTTNCIEKFKTKNFSGKTYLNTTKNDSFQYKSINPLQNLAEADSDDLTRQMIIGKIVGVTSIKGILPLLYLFKKGGVNQWSSFFMR